MTFADDILLGEKKEYSFSEGIYYEPEKCERFMDSVFSSINHMTAYDGDEVCIRKTDARAGEVCSVRIYNDRRFGMENLFNTELGVLQKGRSVKTYVTSRDIYDTLCLIRSFMDVPAPPKGITSWKSKEAMDAEYGILKDEGEKERLVGIISNYMNGNADDSSLFPEYWQALLKILDYDHDLGYSKEIVGELWEKDFAKIMELAKRYPYDPVFAKAAGDIAMCGYAGPRDAKKAYEYYRFASERGYLAGRLALAEMYRDGVSVEKDYDTYRSLVLSIYEDFISAGGEIAMVCINYAIPEVAKVYLDAKQPEKAGEAVIKGISSSMGLWPYGIPVNETDAKLVDMLYEIYGMPEDMPEDQHELADLLVLLKSPCTIQLAAGGKTYEIEAVQKGTDVLVKYDGKYYRNPVSFMNNAAAGDKLIRELEMESMKVIKA